MKKQNDEDRDDGVPVRPSTVRLCDGDCAAALLLSQIMYWCALNDDGSPRRMTISRGGVFWMAKKHEEWMKECGLPVYAAQRKIAKLAEMGVIAVESHFYKGSRQAHIRVLWDTLNEGVSKLTDRGFTEAENSERKTTNREFTPERKITNRHSRKPQIVIPNTETTSETTFSESTDLGAANSGTEADDIPW